MNDLAFKRRLSRRQDVGVPTVEIRRFLRDFALSVSLCRLIDNAAEIDADDTAFARMSERVDTLRRLAVSVSEQDTGVREREHERALRVCFQFVGIDHGAVS